MDLDRVGHYWARSCFGSLRWVAVFAISKNGCAGVSMTEGFD